MLPGFGRAIHNLITHFSVSRHSFHIGKQAATASNLNSLSFNSTVFPHHPSTQNMKGGARATEKEYRTIQSEVFKVAGRSRELGRNNRELGWEIERLEKELGMLTVKKRKLIKGDAKSKGVGGVSSVNRKVEGINVKDGRKGGAEMKWNSKRQKGKKWNNERCWTMVGIGVCFGMGLMMLRNMSREG